MGWSGAAANPRTWRKCPHPAQTPQGRCLDCGAQHVTTTHFAVTRYAAVRIGSPQLELPNRKALEGLNSGGGNDARNRESQRRGAAAGNAARKKAA